MSSSTVVGMRVRRDEYEMINALADVGSVSVSELLREIVMPAVAARAVAAVHRLGGQTAEPRAESAAAG